MILRAYSVQDLKSDIFNTPFFFATDGMALRAFKDLANDRQTIVGRHPSDFRLVQVATFDDNTGIFVPVDQRSLGLASEYLEAPAQEPIRLPVR